MWVEQLTKVRVISAWELMGVRERKEKKMGLCPVLLDI